MFPNSRIEKYYQQCSELLDFSGLSWWLIDLEQDPEVFYCNQTMCETFHLDSSKLQHSVSQTCPIAGDYNKFIAIKNSEKAQRVFNEYRELKNNALSEYRNHFPYFDPAADKVRYFSSRAKALIRDADGQATLLLGIIEPETVSESLYHQARHDSLTGLKNRREFDSQLKFLLNLARREQHFVSLILCDVDHFKLYNDNLGHYTGDQCLKNIARALSESCNRETDIVCRYGGEEFAILTYGNAPNTAALAETIRQRVAELAIPHPLAPDNRVTISLGYTSLQPDQQTNPQTIIELADRALYRAKQQGRNQCAAQFAAP